MLRVRFQHAPRGASPRWSNDIVDADGASADLLRDRARLGNLSLVQQGGCTEYGRQCQVRETSHHHRGISRRCAWTVRKASCRASMSRPRCCCRRPPHAARAFAVFRTSAEVTVPSPLFRVLLLRRLRLPLPVAPRTRACRGRLDPLGDHRAACATCGVLASRALSLERVVARVCQEAGARVARNVRLADMNIDVPVSDDRRIEVVANGLSLWHGAQQAVDATILSPVTRALEAQQPGADVHPAVLLMAPPDANAIKPIPSWCAPAAAAWWSLVSRSEAFLVLRLPPGSGCSLGSVPWTRRRPCVRQRVPRGLPGGPGCSRSLHSAPSPRPCWSSGSLASATSPEKLPSCMRSYSRRVLAASGDWQPPGPR